VRIFTLIVVMALATPLTSQATCKDVNKVLGQLASARLALKDPFASDKKRQAAEQKKPALEQQLTQAFKACNLKKHVGKHPVLGVFTQALADAAPGSPEALAIKSSWAGLDLGIRTLLPDEDLCLMVARGGGSPGRTRCFKAQSKGATSKNLRKVAKGFCASREGDSRQSGIETNKLAALMETPGLPRGFVEQVLDAFSTRCKR
jgi:hypothetical protein